MANIDGIIGYNKKGSSVNKILAAYGNDVIDITAGTGFGLNLTSGSKMEFAIFLDHVFYQNYSETPRTYNGTAWTNKHTGKMLTARYIRPFKSKLYVANVKFTNPQAPLDTASAAITFPSRVAHSDFFVGNDLTWGIEWGRNGRTIGDSPYFYLDNSDAVLVQNFKARNIKTGDPLIITSGDAQLATEIFTIANVESPYRLRMNRSFPVTATSLHYWVGSNWFDVDTDNNDEITGLGENNDIFLIFKLFTLWYYTGTQLRKIPGALGTSSQRSIINKGGYTYYFHGSDPYLSGIYRYGNGQTTLISRAIQPYINGMASSLYDDVVAWEEGEHLRWYLGTLTNTNYDISMTNAVATIHIPTGAWDVSPIADTITCAAPFMTSGRRDIYCGTSDNQILQMQDGNSYNTSPIRFNVETKVYYPSGTEVINEFPSMQVIGRQTKGVKIRYRLWNTPKKVGEWKPLGELTSDKDELILPRAYNEASGIQFGFYETGTLENDTYIEKLSFTYKPLQSRI